MNPETSLLRNQSDTTSTSINCWFGSCVLIVLNVLLICYSKPIALKLIGIRNAELISNWIELGFLAAVCLLVTISSINSLARIAVIVTTIFLSSLIETATSFQGGISWPRLAAIEKAASGYSLVLIPATMLLIFVGSFVDISLRAKPHHQRRNLTISGFLFAMFVIFSLLVWESHVQLKSQVVSGGNKKNSNAESNVIQLDAVQVRREIAQSMVIFAPAILAVMLFGLWCGSSIWRCLVVWLVLIIKATSLPYSPRALANYDRIAVAILVLSAIISINVIAVRALHRRYVKNAT